MCWWNVIADTAFETGPFQVAGAMSTPSGSGRLNAPLARWPGSETVSVASAAVESYYQTVGRDQLNTILPHTSCQNLSTIHAHSVKYPSGTVLRYTSTPGKQRSPGAKIGIVVAA